jgi:hypothetical protein
MTKAVDGASSAPIDLDALLTPAQFAAWLGKPERWVRSRIRILPGVIREDRKTVRIHLRTYLERRLPALGRARSNLGSSSASRKGS